MESTGIPEQHKTHDMDTEDAFMETVGVIGAGAWGTALAHALHSSGLQVTLWTRSQSLAQTISQTHINPTYLAGVPLSPSITVTSVLRDAVAAENVLFVVPTQSLRDVCQAAAPFWRPGTPAILCCKGIEITTGHLASTIVEQELPPIPRVSSFRVRALPTMWPADCRVR